MKKVFFTLMAVCLASGAMAVDLPKQGFGLQIGWAQPIIRLNSPDNPESAKDSLANTIRLKGFKVGLVYDASYIAGFGSTIGLNYTFGLSYGKWRQAPKTIYEYPRLRETVLYHQVELYVDWQYKFEIAKETYLILYTGPTIQCGLAFSMRQDMQDLNLAGEVETTPGDWKDAYNIDKIDDKEDPIHNKADNALRRLNITWGVGAGFQYKRYFLRGGYDFGLINPYKNADFAGGNQAHTRGRYDQWQIKLGVYLWYHE